MTFFERYEAACKQKNILPMSQKAADKLGCSKSNISAFAKNATTPKGEVVANAAKMLDVSSDYLLGLTDNPHPAEHTEKEKQILSFLCELNDEGQDAVIAMISGLVTQGIYKKEDKDANESEQTG